VPWFFKQWGGVRKGKAGRELDGRTHDGRPPRLELPVLDKDRRLAAIAEIEEQYAPLPGSKPQAGCEGETRGWMPIGRRNSTASTENSPAPASTSRTAQAR